MTRNVRADKAGTDWAALLMGLGIGLTVALQLTTMRKADFRDVYQWIDSVARLCALLGTYFALVGVLFVARIPWVERGVGHDRLVTWHRKLAPYSLFLIGFHVLLVLISYASVEHIALYKESWKLLTQYSWMWSAFLGIYLMIQAGVTSYKKSRAKLSYESWWLIHILTYISIAAAMMHQIQYGPMFLNNPLNRAYWIALYVFVFFAIVLWRIGVPVWKSIRHSLKVDRVVIEGPGVVSIIMRGRSIHKLGAQGGQFFNWRFMKKGHFLLQHPYSLSAVPTDKLLRITVKDLGNQSRDLINLKSGTQVFMEGPYGAFTKKCATRKHILLVGGGVGITPVRALAEEFGDTVKIDLIYRASNMDELVLKKELDYLAEKSGGALKVHYLVGSRNQHLMNANTILKIAPHFADCDVYVSGPEGMVEVVRKAAKEVGVPKNRFHDEVFVFHSF